MGMASWTELFLGEIFCVNCAIFELEKDADVEATNDLNIPEAPLETPIFEPISCILLDKLRL